MEDVERKIQENETGQTSTHIITFKFQTLESKDTLTKILSGVPKGNTAANEVCSPSAGAVEATPNEAVEGGDLREAMSRTTTGRERPKKAYVFAPTIPSDSESDSDEVLPVNKRHTTPEYVLPASDSSSSSSDPGEEVSSESDEVVSCTEAEDQISSDEPDDAISSEDSESESDSPIQKKRKVSQFMSVASKGKGVQQEKSLIVVLKIRGEEEHGDVNGAAPSTGNESAAKVNNNADAEPTAPNTNPANNTTNFNIAETTTNINDTNTRWLEHQAPGLGSPMVPEPHPNRSRSPYATSKLPKPKE